MSLLASLVRAYDRLPDAPPYGFSSEKIGFCVVLNGDGTVAEVIDLRDTDKKRSPRMLLVPQAVKRTVGIAPNFLWDKSAYLLGVTAGEGKRTAEEHSKFRERHIEWLAETEDAGLLAFLRFVEGWTAETFTPPLWPGDLRDQNIVFAMADEYRDRYLHDRPAAGALWRRLGAEGASDPQICLVTGDAAPVARLHPSLKGVWGAQSSGASLVSFNLDAFTSYGHDQGDNAPASEAAAFAYTTALNRYLEKDSGHRIQIGDASTVFWADAHDALIAVMAEQTFLSMFGDSTEPTPDEIAAENKAQTRKIEVQLDRIRQGQNLSQVAPDLAEGVRFHVLGLAPNAARLSVRFYWDSDFGQLTANYQRFLSDTKIDPLPRDGWPPLWRFLRELAVLGKSENVPPNLAGDWMRAILTGTPYPLTLLSTALMRIRSDGEINALRAATLKSVLIRNFNSEVPMALDPSSTDKAYVLGRLFAAYENIQRAALGKKVNATIRDKFYGAASSSPGRVFGSLASNAFNHLAKVRKEKPALASYLQSELQEISELLEIADTPFPASLPQEAQAKFALGYYHQANFRKSNEDDQPAVTEAAK